MTTCLSRVRLSEELSVHLYPFNVVQRQLPPHAKYVPRLMDLLGHDPLPSQLCGSLAGVAGTFQRDVWQCWIILEQRHSPDLVVSREAMLEHQPAALATVRAVFGCNSGANGP